MYKINQSASIMSDLSVHFVVLGVILLSGSLYYSTYGTNTLLIPFLVILMGLYLKRNVRRLSTKHMLYVFFSLVIVFSNFDYVPSTAGVFVLNLSIAILIFSLIPLWQFSKIYVRLVIVLSIISWLAIPVIIFGIPPILPDFVTITGVTYSNYIFFGVVQSAMDIGAWYRTGGFFWEPGAFMIFVNLAFAIAIVFGLVTKMNYLIFLITNLTINSTTGLIVFILLSVCHFYDKPKKSGIVIASGIIIVYIITMLSPEGYFLSNTEKFKADTTSSSSFVSRAADFWVDWNMLKDHPLQGIGIGNLPLREKYGIDLTGSDHGFPGADGLFLFITYVGLPGCIMLFPIVFPRYLRYLEGWPIMRRLPVYLSLFFMFNNENMTPYLLSWVMAMYGLSATGARMPVVVGQGKHA